ncbi:MAG TPA: DNA primase [Verrucomicrobia bacterium]|nr:DNA primase [Verrucomicrobiota bacterium]
MAGMVSKDVIEQVRNALDISDVIGSYIQVKRAGHVAKALCPFHKEKTPSFHINPARQAFHCFGCGAGGDVFKFVMLYENVDFPTALRMLASRAGIALKLEESRSGSKEGPAKDELFAANEEASRRYQQELLQSPAAAEARAYLQKRSLDTAAWKEWGIGYAPEGWDFLSGPSGPRNGPKMKALEAAGLLSTNEKGNQYDRFRGRVMFTIRDELGRAVGFSGRVLKADDKAGGKYVNTPETPVFRKSRILFGLDKAKREILDARQALLCEGQIDCIRCHLGGFKNAVASQGTAFTEEHARLLKRYADHAVIVLDADAAGQKAALRSAELLIAEGLAVSLAALPAGEDPDSLILKKGPEAFAAVLKSATTPMGFLLGLLQAKEDLRTQAGLLRATRAAIDLAAHAQGAVQAEQMLREAASGLGVGYDSLQRDLRAAMRQKFRSAEPAGAETPGGVTPPVEHPVDEVELATLLGTRSDPTLAALVREWVPYPLITDPVCRAVIQALAEEETDLMAALDGESEECKAFAAQIVNAPQKLVSTEADMGGAKAAQDLIVRIWQRNLEAHKNELGRRKERLEGADRQEVLQEYAQLLLDLGKMKLGWARAHPIIELHLQRLAEG